MKKRAVLFLLALVMLTVALAPCAMAEQTVKYVYCRNGKPLNVRAYPDVNSKFLGTLENGTRVTIEGYTNNYTWATLIYKGQIAYVMTQYLVDYNPYEPTPTPTPSGDTNIVNAMENEFRTYRVVSPYTVLAKPDRATGWVNLRYAPSTAFGHAGNLYANTQLTVIAETTNWLQVRRNDSGVTGYVMRKYVIYAGVGSGQ
jgi:uncharacterized protein YgiM (DUF1202 family)